MDDVTLGFSLIGVMVALIIIGAALVGSACCAGCSTCCCRLSSTAQAYSISKLVAIR